MISLDRKAGRLIEVVLSHPVSIEEIQEFVSTAKAVPVPFDTKMVVCADLTRAKVLPAKGADLLTELLKTLNNSTERQAFLLDERNAVVTLQVTRMIREAEGKQRKTFKNRYDALRWLSECLTRPEQNRLVEFLQPAQKNAA